MKRQTIIHLVIILMLIVILGVLVYKTIELKNSNQPQMMKMQEIGMQEENTSCKTVGYIRIDSRWESALPAFRSRDRKRHRREQG